MSNPFSLDGFPKGEIVILASSEGTGKSVFGPNYPSEHPQHDDDWKCPMCEAGIPLVGNHHILKSRD